MENKLVTLENGKIKIAEDFTKAYAEFLKRNAEIEMKMKMVKELTKQIMEENNITEPFEDDYLKISYKRASKRTTVDSKRLKEELPDIYEEYSKTSDVSSSVTIEAKC